MRFSLPDGAAVAAMAAASAVLWWSLPELALLPLLLILHFVLFCNTFRVGAIRELLWAGLLVVNTGVWALAGGCTVWRVFVAQTPVTVIVVASAMFSRDYNGIFCTRINPQHYRDAAGREGLFGIRMMRFVRFPDAWIRVLSGKDPDAVIAAAGLPGRSKKANSSSGISDREG
jgi:hypothetical protein